MADSFLDLKKEVQEQEELLEQLAKSIAQYERHNPKKEKYEDEKFISKLKHEDEEKNKRINGNISDLDVFIRSLENEIKIYEKILEDFQIKLLEEKESLRLKIKNISEKNIEMKNNNLKSLEEKNNKTINSLRDEFSKYLSLNNRKVKLLIKDRRFRKIYEETKSDEDIEIIEKLENYYAYENLRFLITNEEFKILLEKIYSNEKYIQFWEDKLETTFDSCTSSECENLNYYSKKIFSTTEAIFKHKLENQAIFLCNLSLGFHLGIQRERKNFLFENADLSKLQQILKSKKFSDANKNKINQEIKNLNNEILEEKERTNNYIKFGEFITNEELIQDQINSNYKAFGKNMDNFERSEYFYNVEILIKKDKTELKNNQDTLKREKVSIAEHLKDVKEKELNFLETGIYETDIDLKKRNQNKKNRENYENINKILPQKKEQLKKLEFDYYTKKSKNIKVDEEMQEIHDRRFDLYDKNSS